MARAAGKEALIMLKMNKPLVALKEERLGNVEKVCAFVRQQQRKEEKARGTEMDERANMVAQAEKYQETQGPQGPKTNQGIAAAATRQKNKKDTDDLVVQFNAGDRSVLVLTETQVKKLKGDECNRLMAAWKAVGMATTRSSVSFLFF